MPEDSEKKATQDDKELATKAEKIESCVLDLKRQGKSKSSAFAICNAAMKNNEDSEDMIGRRFSNEERNPAIQKLASILVEKGIPDKDAFSFSYSVCKTVTRPHYNAFAKFFQETKNLKAHLGTTEKEKGMKHSHDYTLMVLNWGEQLIGVTTATSGDNDHLHSIDIDLSSKIRSFVAYSDLADSAIGEETSNYHKHTFSANLDEMKESTPSVMVRSRYYGENPVAELKDFVEVYSSDKKKFGFTNQREAEALLVGTCQLTEKPEWYEGKDLNELQVLTLKTVQEKYPGSTIFDDSYVAELAEKKGNFVVSASQAKDNKGHFPIDTLARGRNALARVNQFTKSPPWWSGSLKSLQDKIRKAVKNKYPTIKVTGLSDFFAVRFNDGESVFFINCASNDGEIAKDDLYIYSESCKGYDVDLVKFTQSEEDNVEFNEVGSFTFYDKTKARGMIRSSSSEIQLSEMDGDGNTVIEILRTGRFNHPVYGRFEIDTDKLNEIIKNFDGNVLDRNVSFDFNHEPDLPAAAWCRRLSTIRRDVKGNMQDILLAHVDWTPRGKEAIQNGDYMYFSSEYVDNFIDKEDDKEFGTTLKGGGLTNRPWIPGLMQIELSEKRKQVAFINKTNQEVLR